VVPATIKTTTPEASPERAAFCAYGITPNADDPVSLAIHGLIDHASTQTQRVDEIVAALEKLGTRLDAFTGIDGAALLDLKRLSNAMRGEATRR
jgi:serine O-acetyltransferase